MYPHLYPHTLHVHHIQPTLAMDVDWFMCYQKLTSTSYCVWTMCDTQFNHMWKCKRRQGNAHTHHVHVCTCLLPRNIKQNYPDRTVFAHQNISLSKLTSFFNVSPLFSYVLSNDSEGILCWGSFACIVPTACVENYRKMFSGCCMISTHKGILKYICIGPLSFYMCSNLGSMPSPLWTI